MVVASRYKINMTRRCCSPTNQTIGGIIFRGDRGEEDYCYRLLKGQIGLDECHVKHDECHAKHDQMVMAF